MHNLHYYTKNDLNAEKVQPSCDLNPRQHSIHVITMPLGIPNIQWSIVISLLSYMHRIQSLAAAATIAMVRRNS